MTVSIVIIVVGLLGSAFISATEAAVLGARRYRIEHRGEEGDERAELVIRIFDNYERFFGTILLLGNLFNITGILMLYPVHQLRRIPMRLARGLADLACENRLLAVGYVVGAFLVMPLVGILVLG